MGAFLGVSLGSLGAVIGVIALYVAFRALRKPSDEHNEMRRAFTSLENDFEDMQRRVHGELGRISRLKRDGVTIPPSMHTAEPEKKVQVPSPTPPLSRSQLLARAHQKGALFYGEEQNSTSINGGRRPNGPDDE